MVLLLLPLLPQLLLNLILLIVLQVLLLLGCGIALGVFGCRYQRARGVFLFFLCGLCGGWSCGRGRSGLDDWCCCCWGRGGFGCGNRGAAGGSCGWRLSGAGGSCCGLDAC